MIKYGRSLIKELPMETTDLLIMLCTDWPVDRDHAVQAQPPPGAIQPSPGTVQ